jgi:hemicentin
MECIASGVPDPTIQWLREGSPFSFVSNPNLRVLEGGRRLQVNNAQLLDIGGYTCVAGNVAGNTSKEFILGVLGKWSNKLITLEIIVS